jgi:N-methylhydantoinase B
VTDASVDFLAAQVIASNLDAAAQEMSPTVTRTALSPLFNEAHDFTTGIFDFRGQREARLVAQAPGCTPHLYAIVGAVDAILERFRFNLHAGDVLLLNDPYAGGTHGPDWTLIAPVCYQGKPVLLPAVRAHMGDNGGPVAGGYNPRAEEVWQEGLRIPPIKIVDRGETRADVMNLLLANNRLPHWLEGDLAAMIGACRIAEARIAHLFERFGLDVVRGAIDRAIAYSERRVRQQIADWPDGTYVGETWTDHDFHGQHDIAVRATVTIAGDSLAIDFAGSDAQAHGFINSPLTNTRSFSARSRRTACHRSHRCRVSSSSCSLSFSHAGPHAGGLPRWWRGSVPRAIHSSCSLRWTTRASVSMVVVCDVTARQPCPGFRRCQPAA